MVYTVSFTLTNILLFSIIFALVVWGVFREYDKKSADCPTQESFGGYGATSAIQFYNQDAVCDEQGCYVPHHIVL